MNKKKSRKNKKRRDNDNKPGNTPISSQSQSYVPSQYHSQSLIKAKSKSKPNDKYLDNFNLSEHQQSAIKFLSEALSISSQEAHIICNECKWEQSEFPSNLDDARSMLHWNKNNTKSKRKREHNRYKKQDQHKQKASNNSPTHSPSKSNHKHPNSSSPRCAGFIPHSTATSTATSNRCLIKTNGANPTNSLPSKSSVYTRYRGRGRSGPMRTHPPYPSRGRGRGRGRGRDKARMKGAQSSPPPKQVEDNGYLNHEALEHQQHTETVANACDEENHGSRRISLSSEKDSSPHKMPAPITQEAFLRSHLTDQGGAEEYKQQSFVLMAQEDTHRELFEILNGALIVGYTGDIAPPHLCMPFDRLLDLVNYQNGEVLTQNDLNEWYKRSKTKLLYEQHAPFIHHQSTQTMLEEMEEKQTIPPPVHAKQPKTIRKPTRPPISAKYNLSLNQHQIQMNSNSVPNGGDKRSINKQQPALNLHAKTFEPKPNKSRSSSRSNKDHKEKENKTGSKLSTPRPKPGSKIEDHSAKTSMKNTIQQQIKAVNLNLTSNRTPNTYPQHHAHNRHAHQHQQIPQLMQSNPQTTPLFHQTNPNIYKQAAAAPQLFTPSTEHLHHYTHPTTSYIVTNNQQPHNPLQHRILTTPNALHSLNPLQGVGPLTHQGSNTSLPSLGQQSSVEFQIHRFAHNPHTTQTQAMQHIQSHHHAQNGQILQTHNLSHLHHHPLLQ